MPELKTKVPEVKRRLFKVKCYNKDTVVHIGPCIVGNCIISSSAGVGAAQVYDGENANAEHKFCLHCIANTTFSSGAAQDHYFEHGIFITVNALTTHLTVTWYPLER